MKSILHISFLIFFSISLAGCGSTPPKEVSSNEAATTAAPATSAPAAGGIAVGHDSAPAAGSAMQGDAPAGPIKWTPPSRWESKPASGMRAATYLIPAAQGDSEGAECAVFLNNIAGGVDANIRRWIGQFESPDGGPADGKAKQEKQSINRLNVTTVDLMGTFKGGGSMMGQSTGPKTGYRLLGAIVETPEGEVFFKMTGPAKTMAAAQTEFQAMLNSIKK